jgi:hypothetical protein
VKALPPDPSAAVAPDDREVVERARGLLGRGEWAPARALLTPIAHAGGPVARDALALLASLHEGELRTEAAIAAWQAILADNIDDDEAWTHLQRLGREAEVAPPTSAGIGAAAPTLDSGAGVRLSRFEIVGELGRGTFATVYRARDRALALELALKVLHPRSGGGADRGDRAFFAESRRIANLRHRGIVALYDIDEQARTLVMELIPGGTLRDRLRAQARSRGGRADHGALPADELGLLGQRFLAALQHLHAHEIVHGDLSPRNLLLRAPGDPVLVDFGGAHLGNAADQPAGTPLYLAPEQFAGASISAAADLFAAGAVLWEAAAGHPMRTRDDLMAGRTGPRPLPAEVAAGLPAPLVAVIAGMTSADPLRRLAAAIPG